MTDSIKLETYDSFKQYVETIIRDNTNNPRATVQSFMQIPPCGDSHMIIRMDHVVGSGELFELVKKFRPGSELKEEEDFTNGSMRHLAYIPFRDPRKARSSSRRRPRAYHRPRKPSPAILQVSVFAFLVLAIVYLQIQH